MAEKRWQVKHISDETCRRAARIAWTRRHIFSARGRYGPHPHRTPAVLAEITGAPLKVCVRKIEKMSDAGHMDWGVSVDGAWWTEDLPTYGSADDPHWPEESR